MTNIPNSLWLGIGVIITLLFLNSMEMSENISLWCYMGTGILVACAFLAFKNPKTQPGRFDISMCVPILTFMWPIILFTMILERPWNHPEWKNRNSADKIDEITE